MNVDVDIIQCMSRQRVRSWKIHIWKHFAEKCNHPSNLSTEIDRNALLVLENYGGYNNRFFSGCFSANAENIRLSG